MQRALTLKRLHHHHHFKPLTSTTTSTSTQHPFSTTTTTTSSSSSSSQLPKIKYLACTAGLLFSGAIIYDSFSFPNHNKPQQPNSYDYNLKLNFKVFSHLIELKRERDEQAWNFLKTQIRVYSRELYFAKFGLIEILSRDSLHRIPPCGDAIRECLEAIDEIQQALLQLDTSMDMCMRSSVTKFFYFRKFKYWVAAIGKSKREVLDLFEYLQKLEQQKTRRSREY
ncbi:hypothetical protein RGQ29_028619 [Quercus rubra]|uniref:Uncharacterized protein n=1 Tax=Quercus rubra TaxID=3512 RepID=A0AAN7ETK4_QUERU|nr:hypothetical protein RGQ29_028619 [Quercus rubra]